MDKPAAELRVAALEAELAAERARLAENLGTLRGRLRPAALARSAGQALKDRILPPRPPSSPPPRPAPVAPPLSVLSERPVRRPADTDMADTDTADTDTADTAGAAPQTGIAAAAYRVMRDRPLVSAALLATAGAALGAVLPQRDGENRLLRDARALATAEARHFMLDEAVTLALTLAGSLFEPPVQERAPGPGVQATRRAA